MSESASDTAQIREIMDLWGVDDLEARLMLAIQRGERTSDAIDRSDPTKTLSPTLEEFLAEADARQRAT